MIVTDDQRWDSLPNLPRLAARSALAVFDNSYVHQPLCGPSRATMLTGRYSYSHGVRTLLDGANLDESLTVATLLAGAGYRTGFVGKYLNGYPFDRGDYIPPGWDTFHAFHRSTEYYNYELVEDGVRSHYGSEEDDYSTDVLARKAVRFIDQSPTADPIFLLVAPNAPHFTTGGFPPPPAPRHAGASAYGTVIPPRAFGATDTAGEPAWMNEATTPVADLAYEWRIKADREALLSVDELITGVFLALRRNGRLDDTYVMITSDNGFAFGEHRIFGKGHLYEDAVRVPLLVHGPSVVPGHYDRLTSNVDWIPTVLHWTGVAPPPGFLDGRSFAATLAAGPSPRALLGARATTTNTTTTADELDAILLYGCRTGMDGNRECGGNPEHMGRNWGLRTTNHKYVEYPDGYVQLFDLDDDPHELTNLALGGRHRDVVSAHSRCLASLRPVGDPAAPTPS